MATLDATTLAEYTAETNAVDRAQVIVDALTDPVSVKVYDPILGVVGSGTMTAPWAVIFEDQIIPGTLDGFFSTETSVPNSGWYLRFESGSRYVQLTFGLLGSGKEAVWELDSYEAGTRSGIGAGAITVTGNHRPVWAGAPSTYVTTSADGSYDFGQHASDPDDDDLSFSLVTTPSGYSISGGIVTIAAGSASQTITVRASDGALTADHVCAVTVASVDLGTVAAGTEFEESWATDGYVIDTTTVLITEFGGSIRGSASSSSRPSILSTPVYDGSRAMRCGFAAATLSSSSPVRSEIAWFGVDGFGTGNTEDIEGKECFVGFALRLGTPANPFPTSLPAGGTWYVLHQVTTYNISPYNQPGSNPTASLSIRMRGTPEVLRYVMEQRLATNLGEVILDADPLDDLNAWTAWQIHYRLSMNGSGFIRYYRNGIRIYPVAGSRSLENINTITPGTTVLPQFKNGMYGTWRTLAGVAGQTVQAHYAVFDSMRFATPDTGGSLETVDPRNYA